jgi:hypothetical protein
MPLPLQIPSGRDLAAAVAGVGAAVAVVAVGVGMAEMTRPVDKLAAAAGCLGECAWRRWYSADDAAVELVVSMMMPLTMVPMVTLLVMTMMALRMVMMKK